MQAGTKISGGWGGREGGREALYVPNAMLAMYYQNDSELRWAVKSVLSCHYLWRAGDQIPGFLIAIFG